MINIIKLETLNQKLIRLSETVNSIVADKSLKHRITDLLEENDLDKSENVPFWFMDFLNAILEKRSTGRVGYTPDPSKGDTSNMLAELEEIVKADWDDYGEAVEIKIRLLAFLL